MGQTGKVTTADGPTLADDERQLAAYSEDLAARVAHVVPTWLASLVERRAPGVATEPAAVAQLAAGAEATMTELRALLETDIDAQRSGPLEVLRQAVRFPTAVLAEAGIEPAERDDFATRNFPDDLFNLTPASFAAVDPSLHEPGLIWGAAKAHVHLRRRREAESNDMPEAEPEEIVVALSRDLMDQSKIKGTFPDVRFVRSPSKLAEAAASATLVLVDLNVLDDPALLATFDAQVVAFGSHVNQEALEAAEAAGAQAVARSVFFKRLESPNL